MRRFKNEGLFEEKHTVSEIKEAIAEVKEEQAQEAPTQAEAPQDDVKSRIQKLKELRDEGLITDEEFEQKKKDIIDSL